MSPFSAKQTPLESGLSNVRLLVTQWMPEAPPTTKAPYEGGG
jgi:hypothetical protein